MVQPVKIEPAPEWTDDEVWDKPVDAFEPPVQAPQAAALGAFMTQKGKDAAQVESASATVQEVPVEALKQYKELLAECRFLASEEAIQPHALEDEPLDMETQVERDLKAIFSDDYFAALVQRAIVAGPQNVGKKIVVLKVLAQILSKTLSGLDYAKELLEIAQYLADIDELVNY
jgi:hypothetical protein